MNTLFDDISRVLGSGMPRRKALRLIAGGLAGTAIAPLWPDQVEGITVQLECCDTYTQLGVGRATSGTGKKCDELNSTERAALQALACARAEDNTRSRAEEECPPECPPAELSLVCNPGSCVANPQESGEALYVVVAEGRYHCCPRDSVSSSIDTNPDTNAPNSPLTALEVTVVASSPGLASIEPTTVRNLRVEIPKGSGNFFGKGEVFTPATHTTEPLVVRAERIDMAAGGALMMRACNANGCCELVDPVVETLTAEIPEGFALEQNYPNPLSSTTAIPFRLPEKAHVTLTVYDALGRKVATLVDEEMSPGTYEVQWEAARDLSSGTYFYRFEAGPHTESRRMTLVK